MLKVMTIGISILMVFCCVSISAENKLEWVDEERYLNEIKKIYPVFDDRHKFAVAMLKLSLLMDTKSFEEDGFIPIFNQNYSILSTFLTSHDKNIQKYSENAIRFIKAILIFQISSYAPDDESKEEVKISEQKIYKIGKEAGVFYFDFLRSCIPEKQWVEALKIGKEKIKKIPEKERRFKNVDNTVWLGDNKLSIVNEILRLNDRMIGYNSPLAKEIFDFLNKKKYVTGSQYNELVQIYYDALESH